MRLSPKIHFVIVILLYLTWFVLIGVETLGKAVASGSEIGCKV